MKIKKESLLFSYNLPMVVLYFQSISLYYHPLHRFRMEFTKPLLSGNYMPEDHTGEHLSTSLMKWGLHSTKLVAITTDNGNNSKLPCELLTWMHVSCFGHNLDLAINKGLNDSRVDRVISLCRKALSSFSYTVRSPCEH